MTLNYNERERERKVERMYKKLNKRPLKIYTETKYPYFKLYGTRCRLSDCIRTHNNKWVNDKDYPKWIHGIYVIGFMGHFIELIDDEHVNVYTYERDKEPIEYDYRYNHDFFDSYEEYKAHYERKA